MKGSLSEFEIFDKDSRDLVFLEIQRASKVILINSIILLIIGLGTGTIFISIGNFPLIAIPLFYIISGAVGCVAYNSKNLITIKVYQVLLVLVLLINVCVIVFCGFILMLSSKVNCDEKNCIFSTLPSYVIVFTVISVAFQVGVSISLIATVRYRNLLKI
jgi:hypothetical protein